MVQRIQLQLAVLSLLCDGTIMRFIFQFAFLHLQLQGFSAFASPRNQACVTGKAGNGNGNGNGKLKWKLLHGSGLESPKLPLLVQDKS